LENILEDALCFLKVLSDKCLRCSIVTRAHVPRQVAATGKLAEAEQLLRDVVDKQQHNVGASHPDTLLSRYNLAMVLVEQVSDIRGYPMLLKGAEWRVSTTVNSDTCPRPTEQAAGDPGAGLGPRELVEAALAWDPPLLPQVAMLAPPCTFFCGGSL
jgi:hypothetical protein